MQPAHGCSATACNQDGGRNRLRIFYQFRQIYSAMMSDESDKKSLRAPEVIKVEVKSCTNLVRQV